MIVHGGHADDNDMEAGFERWVKALDYLETDVPVYLENTAGGDHAMARHFDTIARLWDHIGDKGIGFCLDTCHAWAAGEALIDAVERIKAITGRIDLVHCNDSRDAAGSGADRHANFGTGQIDPQLLVAVVDGGRCAGDLRDRRRGAQGRHRVPAGASALTTGHVRRSHFRRRTGVERRVAAGLISLRRESSRFPASRGLCVRN